MHNRVSQAESLRTIPRRKLLQQLDMTPQECGEEGHMQELSDRGRALNEFKRRCYDANIPLEYWRLRMDDFKGSALLKKKYEEIVSDLDKIYNEGLTLCFAGAHGRGKTMVCANILKEATKRGYQCLYVTLSDIVSNAVSNSSDKYTAKRELMMTDFLVIDEFDGRHMGSGAGADLFGRLLEDVLRKRIENHLPLFMCTNSTNVIDSFEGDLKQSIGSLMSRVDMVPVLGKDFRKGGV